MKFINKWGSMLVTVLATPFWLPGQAGRKIDQRSPAHADVYVAGAGRGAHDYEPCYWKNGTRIPLEVINTKKDGVAYAVYVSGSDVYTVGTVADLSGIDMPCYWKNGSRVLLCKPDNTKYGAAYSIMEYNDDVYVAGCVGDSLRINAPCYWKNGVRIDLDVPDITREGYASSICVSGAAIYVCGNHENTIGVQVPCYWKNGKRTDLPISDTTLRGEARSICVKGKNVYIAGYYNFSMKYEVSRNLSTCIPCYWTNGIRTDLGPLQTGKAASAYSVFLSGGDLYVSGASDNGAGYNVPCYWKNDKIKELQLADTVTGSGYAYSLYVLDKDVYAAGLHNDPNGLTMPCYWKNGVRTDLPAISNSRTAFANSIFVTK